MKWKFLFFNKNASFIVSFIESDLCNKYKELIDSVVGYNKLRFRDIENKTYLILKYDFQKNITIFEKTINDYDFYM